MNKVIAINEHLQTFNNIFNPNRLTPDEAVEMYRRYRTAYKLGIITKPDLMATGKILTDLVEEGLEE